ncbi:TPA: hypothetical protein N0F65_003492 [Lagenidium giganteum]|uniref:Uncharacterized protein n=1 Tax=Lagenidium giganteum TaxID=4803 RepID=A0AAV2YK14_9STRA|nr:TPA: hypothetical protein N0F65_003492 [Lagenidium giganteum]
MPSLADTAPIKMFTGLPMPSPLKTIMLPGQVEKLVTATDANDDVERVLVALRNSIQNLHKAAQAEKAKQRAYKQRSAKHEQAVEFTVGDYVLHSRVDEVRHPHKLEMTWVGSYIVIKPEEYYFVVEHLISKEQTDVLPSRLKFYTNSSLLMTEELVDHVAAQGTKLGIEAIVDRRVNGDT